jgi:nitrile hydratase
MAMTRAMCAVGAVNQDMLRFAREILPPRIYLSSTYYQRWLLGLQQLLLDKGLVDADELTAGRALRPGKPLKRGKLTGADISRVMTRASFGRPATVAARFTPGDRVRAKNIHPATHTRLPRYVRGHVGVVERDHGCHVFPDSAALGAGDNPQWLYTVVFESRDLWGPDAEPTTKISIEAFEPYLEPA